MFPRCSLTSSHSVLPLPYPQSVLFVFVSFAELPRKYTQLNVLRFIDVVACIYGLFFSLPSGISLWICYNLFIPSVDGDFVVSYLALRAKLSLSVLL